MGINYFDRPMTIQEAKKIYWTVAQAIHPDHGGTDAEFSDLNNQFQAYCRRAMKGAFDEAGDTKTGENNAGAFADILRAAMLFNCRIEIIGFWIYAFDSLAVKDELKALGFWYSGKHKAWIYSGSVKRRIHTRNSTDDNRARWGCDVVREKEAAEAIA
jgi:hypothetical protein